MMTKMESEQRIIRLQTELRAKGIDGALIIFPIDVYYFTGTRQNATLWVPADGNPLLLVRKSYSRAVKESLIEDTRPFPSSKEFPTLFSEDVKKVGLTFDIIPVQQYNYYAKMLPGRELVDISGINRELRSVKSAWELDRLRECGARLCEVFTQVPTFLKVGMREIDLAAEFECRLRKAGSEGYIRMRAFNQELFQGLAVSGATAAEPGFFDGAVTGRGLSNASPYGASTETITPGTPILLDFAGIFKGYLVDMTRIFVIGSLSSELEHAFATSLRIHQYLVENLKPGTICEELFARSLEMAEAAGLGRNYMGAPGENAKFVGHGVGLELDEFPVLAQGFKVPLQAGQTIAIEPKFVIPGQGVIGIENTFAVTSRGGEKLTSMADDIVFL
ncbi:peptidase M24 [Geobacter metallireducens RCH3]|uniref:Aminopeptidase, putative n=1 Tax=Geobacter metallireducens (strain ATCC 53774 / DSM 7210 / GS-15) TaxID=269799 RepID=Q39UX3_GEOMG|nr:Xaa-Pro peptidase family protein [Geobacter metallireducens]ABB31951.1 aminopeptidase, putative [Geobacter metallireducens GS-15]EHP86336.1 peptidase M24 [Geobacter metallireducens RCH3]